MAVRTKIQVYQNAISGLWQWRLVDGDIVVAMGNLGHDSAVDAANGARRLGHAFSFSKVERIEQP